MLTQVQAKNWSQRHKSKASFLPQNELINIEMRLGISFTVYDYFTLFA